MAKIKNIMPDKAIKSTPLPRRLIGSFFAAHLEFRVRLFHVLAMGGTLVSFAMCILSTFNYTGISQVLVNAMLTVLSFSLLMYSRRSGRYQICYMITIIAIFLGLFPMLFFSSGGYYGGMLAFFIFAVVFTIFMLEGIKAVIFSIVEVIFYTALFISAYLRPEWVNQFDSELGALTDIIISYATVSAVLGVCLYIHFRLYNAQQRQLDEQNAVLAQANRAKTEFLANASHEMRTPLTVTSVNVQVVMMMLEDMGESLSDPEARELLENAQSEIMRLSRMVGGMLTLASMSEDTDRRKLDYTALLHSGVEMLRLTLASQGIVLETDIKDGLIVFGNADLLAQVLTNLLQNARAHTKNGTVKVYAEKHGTEITVTVRDTGSGIEKEILHSVFERGVSTGGTGFGLFLCKTVVESHGGSIWIESEPGNGTAVFFTLPVYEGQIGGE